MIKQMRPVYPLPFLRGVFKVSSSSYYAWLNRKPSKRAKEDARLEVEIKAAHKRTKETCGPERLQNDMAEHGIHAGVCRIRRIRKKLGIRCKQVKKFKATTDSGHNLAGYREHSGSRTLRLKNQIRYGYQTLHIYRQMRDGFILQGIRICVQEK